MSIKRNIETFLIFLYSFFYFKLFNIISNSLILVISVRLKKLSKLKEAEGFLSSTPPPPYVLHTYYEKSIEHNTKEC